MAQSTAFTQRGSHKLAVRDAGSPFRGLGVLRDGPKPNKRQFWDEFYATGYLDY